MKHGMRKRIIIYIFCITVTLLAGGCGIQKSNKVTYTDTAMGTVIQQTLYVKENLSGEEIPTALMDLLDSLEQNTLSWRVEGSEIFRINASAGSIQGGLESQDVQGDYESEDVQGDEELKRIQDSEQHTQSGHMLSEGLQDYMRVIQDVWGKSDGALDITVGPMTRLWNIDTYAGNTAMHEESDTFLPPTDEAISAALTNTGFKKVRLEDGRIFLPEGMQLDMGAVGKGIACDEVRKFLEEQDNVIGAVISVGGSVLTFGEKADKTPWTIGIQHPREPGASIALLKIPGNLVVSTSGDYERYVETNGVRYHHILNPKTGRPADSGVISVTIVSESGILSDALSTACFVLGKDAGLALAEAYDAEAFIVDSAMQISMTEGMDKFLVLQ